MFLINFILRTLIFIVGLSIVAVFTVALFLIGTLFFLFGRRQFPQFKVYTRGSREAAHPRRPMKDVTPIPES